MVDLIRKKVGQLLAGQQRELGGILDAQPVEHWRADRGARAALEHDSVGAAHGDERACGLFVED